MSAAAVATVAHAFYIQQQQTTRAAVDHAQQLWTRMPTTFDVAQWNAETLPLLLDVLAKAQLLNATRSRDYLERIAKLQGWEIPDGIDPEAFLTEQALGSEMLNAAGYRTLGLQAAGAPALPAALAGQKALIRTFGDLVQDSGAVASQVQMALSPQCNGYYRKLQLPSCHRCAVLAGAHYKWHADFNRHPGCDCTAVPAGTVGDGDTYAPEFDSDAALERGQITGLSKADRAAVLEDGADFNQVANARRSGLRSEVIYGRRVQTTTEGVTRRGNFGRQAGKLQKVQGVRYRVTRSPRLTPSEIYRQADDRDHARRLLARNGYVLR